MYHIHLFILLDIKSEQVNIQIVWKRFEKRKS